MCNISRRPPPTHQPSKKFIHLKNSQSGFSLVEVIVITALASIAMLGIMFIFNNLSRAHKSLNQSGDFDNLTLLIKMALKNPLTCPGAIQNASGDIQTIKLEQVVAGSPLNASPISYAANLRIQGSKTAAGSPVAIGGGVLNTTIPISITLQVPISGGPAIIQSCSTAGDAIPSPGKEITTPARKFPSEFVCNNVNVSGTDWSFVFRFHGIEHAAAGNEIRYRDLTGGRYVDFYANGNYKSSSSAGSCAGQTIDSLNSTTN